MTNQTELAIGGSVAPVNGIGGVNEQAAMIWAILNDAHTATLVQVISCTNSGGVSPVGTVNVQPLVDQIAGDSTTVPHGVLHEIPYFRLQGGTNAVILDPQPGDIGIAVFADRDISKAKATKAQAAPGSFRKFDMADGLYIGGVLNGTPSQYVQFNAGGITVTSPGTVTINAEQTTINAPTTVNGLLTYTQGMVGSGGGSATAQISGDVVANGISLVNHVHSGVQTGAGNTGKPV